jgi:hypothetical protein
MIGAVGLVIVMLASRRTASTQTNFSAQHMACARRPRARGVYGNHTERAASKEIADAGQRREFRQGGWLIRGWNQASGPAWGNVLVARQS